MNRYSLMLKMINIGCGTVFHRDWINLDLVSMDSAVMVWDLRKGFPFSNNSIDVCYSSHFIEHLSQAETVQVLHDCFRVLRQGGVIRLVVPDLEAVVNAYLDSLKQVDYSNPMSIDKHEWMTIELIDQMIRTQTGGTMGIYLRSGKNREFVRSRLGEEADWFWDRIDNSSGWWQKVKDKSISQLLHLVRERLLLVMVRVTLGRSAMQGVQEGLFRNRGEVHRWMYDCVSLTKLLEDIGFVSVQICAPEQSQILNFSTYELDVRKGEVFRPHSLYVEAKKA